MMTYQKCIAEHQHEISNSVEMLVKILDAGQYEVFDDYSRKNLENITHSHFAQVFSAWTALKIMSENDIEISELVAQTLGYAVRYCAMYLPISSITDDYRIYLNDVSKEILGGTNKQIMSRLQPV